MLKVGITGGIGSGKSIVCRVFHTLGIPVFDADQSARYLMEHDPELIHKISSLLGEQAYANGKLNRQFVAKLVFAQPALLDALNAIVHPATTLYAAEWHSRQNAPYTIKEAALFFEVGTDKDMDIMVGVSAPFDLRLARAMSRNGLSRAEVISRMEKQIDEEQKMNLCQFVIVNNDIQPILPQVLSLHQQFLEQSTNP